MTPAVPAAPGAYVLGVDSGGSGLRVALGRVGTSGPLSTVLCAKPVRTGAGGIDAGHLLEQVLAARELLRQTGPSAADDAGAGGVAALAIGAAGMATLGERLRAELPGALADALGVRRVALAADAVTAYAGAMGQRPGAVVAGGTGMIALGTDLKEWCRADGWGHLLGDSGGGAWIGRAGLDAAMRALDGRRGGSPALLERLRAVFGPAEELPGLLYPRSDRLRPCSPRSRRRWRRAPERTRSPPAFCGRPPVMSRKRRRPCARRQPGRTARGRPPAKWP